ncbi:hypothetical protein GCM10009087_06670 [Sphingomonas oligophenolica]
MPSAVGDKGGHFRVELHSASPLSPSQDSTTPLPSLRNPTESSAIRGSQLSVMVRGVIILRLGSLAATATVMAEEALCHAAP